MFLLCRCGGLRCGIAALHGMGVGRYGLGASPRPPLWIADQVRNDVTMRWHCFQPLLPVSGTGTGFGPLSSRERGFGWLCWLVGMPHPVVSRLRGNDGPMWLVLFTLTPVSGTGTGFGPLSSRERDLVGCFGLLLPRPSPLD